MEYEVWNGRGIITNLYLKGKSREDKRSDGRNSLVYITIAYIREEQTEGNVTDSLVYITNS